VQQNPFMQRAQIIGKSFAFVSGQILTENYDATIKKLAFLGKKRFIQIVPARAVAGRKHLETALEHALSSFPSKTNFAKRPELEFIVRLLAEKQLEKALKKAEFADEPLVLVLELKGAAKAKNLKVYSDLDISKYEIGDHGPHYSGWYVVLKK